MAQESGATGVIEGAAGGRVAVAAAPEALAVPVLVPVPDGEAGSLGDWVMSAAASSGRAESGGMLGRESVGKGRLSDCAYRLAAGKLLGLGGFGDHWTPKRITDTERTCHLPCMSRLCIRTLTRLTGRCSQVLVA